MEISAPNMEFPETEGTETPPEFPDYETVSPDVAAGTGLPDDAVTENGSYTPELSLPEDIGEASTSDEDSPEEDSGGDSGEDTELSPEDDIVEEPEEGSGVTEGQPVSVSGNDTVTVSGNAVIFPEDFDFSMFSVGDPDSLTGLDALIEAETYQTEVICSVSVGIMFFLGIIAGILLIHGFRLRRV